jgi:hypothetical protein
MPGCGNQNDNTRYVAAGRPGIALRLLGGGANGSSGTGMEGGSNRQMMRLNLRQAWNGQAATGVSNGLKISATPFRAVNNAGDLLNRKNYTSGGSNQAKPDGTGVPSSNTNVKWVYDGSDYTKFKKQQANNRNFNDSSFSGAGKSNTFIALNRVRR